MTVQTTCPDPVRLRDLLDNRLSDTEQVAMVGHLDDCECCQHSLEEIAAGGSSCTEALRHVHLDAPAATSAFWPALQAVEQDFVVQADEPGFSEESEPVEELEPVALDFLSPTNDPSYRGKLGTFDVIGVIGRGGMGVVLKAFDPCLQRFVALKVLDPKLANEETARKRFCREARAAAAVTHEHVVAVHQVEREETRDLPFLVMQLVTGVSLEQRLKRANRLPLAEVLRIGMQTASGLAAAHAQGLVHRDVKPANILLEAEHGRVKLTDFGLARAVEDVKLTQTGFVAGTPLYMAPEQARGETIDHRSDLFSLGSVLYEMCTGKPPFEGNTPFVVLRRVTEELPRPIREVNTDVPDWLVAVIDRLHAKKPEDRIQSAEEVADLLGQQLALLRHSTELTLPAIRVTPTALAPPPRPGPWLLSHAVAAIAGALLMLAVHPFLPSVSTGPKPVGADVKAGPIAQPPPATTASTSSKTQ